MLTKQEAITELTARGVDFDPEMSVKEIRELEVNTRPVEDVDPTVKPVEPTEPTEPAVEPVVETPTEEPEKKVADKVLVSTVKDFTLYRIGKGYELRKESTNQLVSRGDRFIEGENLLRGFTR